MWFSFCPTTQTRLKLLFMILPSARSSAYVTIKQQSGFNRTVVSESKLRFNVTSIRVCKPEIFTIVGLSILNISPSFSGYCSLETVEGIVNIVVLFFNVGSYPSRE